MGIVTVIFDVLWLSLIGLAVWRAWRFFTRQPIVDPAHPPDIGNFALPPQLDQQPDNSGLRQTPEPSRENVHGHY